jgi:hypothetical protein
MTPVGQAGIQEFFNIASPKCDLMDSGSSPGMFLFSNIPAKAGIQFHKNLLGHIKPRKQKPGGLPAG